MAVRASVIELCYVLTNRSTSSLTGTKVEVLAEAFDGNCLPGASKDAADDPADRYSTFDVGYHSLDRVKLVQPREPAMSLEDAECHPICHIPVGTLLRANRPERRNSSRALGLPRQAAHASSRILASELATPIEHMVELRIDGQSQHIQDEYLAASGNSGPVRGCACFTEEVGPSLHGITSLLFRDCDNVL